MAYSMVFRVTQILRYQQPGPQMVADITLSMPPYSDTIKLRMPDGVLPFQFGQKVRVTFEEIEESK